MLINFSVQNFGSIKDRQTLSFEADKDKHLEDYYVIHTNGLRLLKLALIYGANASGKTTILKALDFLCSLVLFFKLQKTETFDFKPFLFDENTPKQNTIFNIDFIQNNTRYLYEVELNQKFIVREALFRAKTPNTTKKALNIFERTTDTEKQLTNIVFNSEIKIDEVYSKTLTANTLWNDTVLSGFLKTNIDLKELTDVTSWFKDHLPTTVYSQSQLETDITKSIDERKINKATVIDILKKADFNLSGISITEEENNNNTFVGLLNLAKNYNNPTNKIQVATNRGWLTTFSLEFEHTVKGKSYSLPFEKESQGTQRYYGFAGLLYLLTKKSVTLSIDELESSLHPDLFQHFLLSFLVNSKKSQLIATTHNREILNNKDIFRNDAIWITDKDNKDCATELYSLADFDTKVIRDTTNILNAYKLGKLGGVPNLSDYYIDVESDEGK